MAHPWYVYGNTQQRVRGTQCSVRGPPPHPEARNRGPGAACYRSPASSATTPWGSARAMHQPRSTAPVLSLLLLLLLHCQTSCAGDGAHAPPQQQRYMGFYANEFAESYAKGGSRVGGLARVSGWLNLLISDNATFLQEAKRTHNGFVTLLDTKWVFFVSAHASNPKYFAPLNTSLEHRSALGWIPVLL